MVVIPRPRARGSNLHNEIPSLRQNPTPTRQWTDASPSLERRSGLPDAHPPVGRTMTEKKRKRTLSPTPTCPWDGPLTPPDQTEPPPHAQPPVGRTKHCGAWRGRAGPTPTRPWDGHQDVGVMFVLQPKAMWWLQAEPCYSVVGVDWARGGPSTKEIPYSLALYFKNSLNWYHAHSRPRRSRGVCSNRIVPHLQSTALVTMRRLQL